MTYEQLKTLGIEIDRGAFGESGQFPTDFSRPERKPGPPVGCEAPAKFASRRKTDVKARPQAGKRESGKVGSA